MTSSTNMTQLWTEQVSVEFQTTIEARLRRTLLKAELETFGGGSLRAVPLFSVSEAEEGKTRSIFVGNVTIFVRGAKTLLRVRLAEGARADAAGSLSSMEFLHAEPSPKSNEIPELAQLEMQLKERLHKVAESMGKVEVPDPDENRSAAIAKGLVEESVNAVSSLRGIRYDLERQLIPSGTVTNSPATSTAADGTRKTRKEPQRLATVSSLAMFGILVDKGADQAHQAVREGLWLHIPNRTAYHAYRRHIDQTIIKNEKLPAADDWTWMHRHDAANRQCLSLQNQLSKEAESVRSLMAAASSISSAREADAQANFNVIVAVASLAIGIPALVFTLYGVENLVELEAAWWAAMPLTLPITLIAIWLTYYLRRRNTSLIGWLIPTAIWADLSVLQIAIALAP